MRTLWLALLLCSCGPTHDLKDVPEDSWNQVQMEWVVNILKSGWDQNNMDRYGEPIGCAGGTTNGIDCYAPYRCIPGPSGRNWLCGTEKYCESRVMVRDSQLNELLNYYPECQLFVDAPWKIAHTHTTISRFTLACPNDVLHNWAMPWPPFIWTDANCNWRPPVGT